MRDSDRSQFGRLLLTLERKSQRENYLRTLLAAAQASTNESREDLARFEKARPSWTVPPATSVGVQSSLATLPERRDFRDRDALVERVRSEFQEIPGVSVTLAQASRLFGISQEVCDRVLSALVREGMVHVTVNGYYRRKTNP